MGRALSVYQLLAKKNKLFEFDGRWKDAFGCPQEGNTIFIMAPVASGKTTFISQFSKYLTKFSNVLYNSIEEGYSESIKQAWIRTGMKNVARKIKIIDESYDELCWRLSKRRSPKIVVIDTIQHWNLTKQQYINLKKQFPRHTFVFISHMDGKNPQGNVAEHVYQDAAVKVTIKGYVAFPSSRYGGNTPLIIWEEGAAKYHGPAIQNYMS
jgi:hypothetical protein